MIQAQPINTLLWLTLASTGGVASLKYRPEPEQAQQRPDAPLKPSRRVQQKSTLLLVRHAA